MQGSLQRIRIVRSKNKDDKAKHDVDEDKEVLSKVSESVELCEPTKDWIKTLDMLSAEVVLLACFFLHHFIVNNCLSL